MKLCKNCGTPQKDENFRCVECGAILPNTWTIGWEVSCNSESFTAKTNWWFGIKTDMKIHITFSAAGTKAPAS